MPQRFMDVMGNLGDAIAGVDRGASFRAGQQQRAEYDETQAQAEAAMALAMERRKNAELREMEKRVKDSEWNARQRFEVAAQDPEWDPNNANIADLTLGGLDAYDDAMQGRNYGQQNRQREIVGTPEGGELAGMIVTQEMRDAAADALAPGSAVAVRRPRAPGAPLIVEDPENPGQTIAIDRTTGAPVQVQTPSGPQKARPAARPSATGAQGTTQQRNYEWLTKDLGVADEQALRLATNSDVDMVAVYQRGVSQADRFATDEERHAAGMRAVEQALQLQTPLLPPQRDPGVGDELGGGGDLGAVPDGLPPGSTLAGTTTSGQEVWQTPDGQKFVVEE